MGFNIPFLADVRPFIKGTDNMADALDDVSDSLEDLGKIKATDKLEDGLDSAAKEAKGFESKVKDAFDGISKEARDAGDKVGKSQKDGLKQAEGGLTDFRDEANSTAKESAASFDGSAESILDSFQEVAANAFGGFGPAGAAAGLAVAVGMGIAISAMQDTAEKATEAKEKAVEMVDGIKEAGGDLANMDLADKIIGWGREVMEDNWITFWADESSTKFQETAKDAKEYGVSARDAIRAASGSAEDSRKFLDATADDWQKLTKEIDENTTVTEAGAMVFGEAGRAAQKKRDALSDLRGQAEENIKTTQDAVEIYNLEKDALGETEEAAKAAADAIKEKADATREAAGNAMDVVEAENAWIETSAQLTKDIATNGATLDVNTAAGRANRQNLVELAQSATGYRDAAIAAGDSTAAITERVQAARTAFIDQAMAAGASKDAATALADQYGLIPATVETLVKANGTEEAKAAIDAIPDATKTDVAVSASGTEQTQADVDAVHGTEVEVTTTEQGASKAQRTIDSVKGKDVKIDVDDEYTVSEVQKRIDGIRGKDVGVTVTLTNIGAVEERLRQLTLPRTAYVDVVQRPGSPLDN